MIRDDRRKIALSNRMLSEIRRVQAALSVVKDRPVTYNEVLEELIRHWDATEATVRDATRRLA